MATTYCHTLYYAYKVMIYFSLISNKSTENILEKLFLNCVIEQLNEIIHL